MSRWEKRSQEDKERILKEQTETKEPTYSYHGIKVNIIPYESIKSKCDTAQKKAGNEGKNCHACDLRCPGCPFESAWPKENKDGELTKNDISNNSLQ
jgi:hypothetical protein